MIAESLHSEPQFENEHSYPNRGKIIGYVVGRPFEMKVRDVAGFPKLADKPIAIGGTGFSTINGGLLWTKAVAIAREQARRRCNGWV